MKENCVQIKEHRHLLSHPTITSFLWMKWRKLRPLFYLNVVLYLLFVGLLSTYVLLRVGEESDQAVQEEEKGKTFNIEFGLF